MLRSFLGFGWFWGNVWRMTKKGLPAWSLTLYKGRIVQSKTQSVAQSGNSGNAMHPNCHNNENRFDLGFDTGVNMTNICKKKVIWFVFACLAVLFLLERLAIERSMMMWRGGDLELMFRQFYVIWIYSWTYFEGFRGPCWACGNVEPMSDLDLVAQPILRPF